jgi:hypothetical protein
MKLASAQNADMAGIIDIVRTLILDEAGKEIITAELMLPADILIAAISKITSTLGK